MCRRAFGQTASRTEPFWRRRRAGILWERVRSVREWAGSPAQFSKCCDGLTHNLDVGIFGERPDLIARCGVADIADHSGHSCPHFWIRASQVSIELIESSVEFAQLDEVD